MNSTRLKALVLVFVCFSVSAFAGVGPHCFDRSSQDTAEAFYGRFTVRAPLPETSYETISALLKELTESGFVEVSDSLRMTSQFVMDVRASDLKYRRTGAAVFFAKAREKEIL